MSSPDELPPDNLAAEIAEYTDDPLGFVLFAFPWGEGELEKHEGPDDWQRQVLEDLGRGIITASEAIQIAVASGHGIGKSALVAWIILWAISTFEDTRGVVTANTDTQLRTKTWPELAKWHRLFIGKDLFTLTATAIYSAQAEHEKTWRVDIIPWSEHNTEAFAGLHNQGKRILLVFDEASAISDKIWEVTDGALTDENTEIVWCAFGNPTRNTGRFFDCFNKLRHRWIHRQIDSRTVKITNKKALQAMVEDHGEDSDFVRVRVRGTFPSTSDHQFIPTDVVDAAAGRHLRPDQYSFAPKIIGVDPAWTGGDETVIVMRQGLSSKILARYKKNDDDFYIAGQIAYFEDQEKADAVVIDLGYGTGIYSAGKQLKRNWILIPFGGASPDRGFVDMRGHMWNQMKQWLKSGGAIPNDPTLRSDLTGPEAYVKATGPHAGKLYLESKADMKSRGLASPNLADAIAITFAVNVRKKETMPAPTPYDPYKQQQTGASAKYDPLA